MTLLDNVDALYLERRRCGDLEAHRRPGRSIMAIRVWVIGLVLGLTSPAWAGDFCISLGGTDVIVGKNFRVPPRNACRPFAGFERSGGFYVATVTGSACVGSDGGAMGMSLVAVHPGVPLGALTTLALLDDRIAINVSLPLVNGPQVNEATRYAPAFSPPFVLSSETFATQLFGVQALPCVPPVQDVPRPISHLP